MSNTANLSDIVSNAGPLPVQQPQQSSGTASLDDIVANHGPADSSASASTPSFFQQASDSMTNPDMGSDFVRGLGEGAVTAAGETIQGLPWIGKKIISPESMQAERAAFAPGSPAEKSGQYAGQIAEPILEFVLGDEALKGLALADKIGLAGQISKIATEHPYIAKLIQHGVLAARMGTVAGTQALAKGASPAAAAKTAAVTGLGGAATSAALDAAPALVNPFRMAIEGKGYAAPETAAAVRGGVRSAAEAAAGGPVTQSVAQGIEVAPIVKGPETVFDDTMATLQKQESAAYKKLDQTAGFDLKAEKTQLSNDQYKLKQLGNTPADQVQRKTLTDAISDSQTRIADAESRLRQAGINPNEADAIHRSRMAGSDIKNAVVRATGPDGVTDANKLLNNLKPLRLSKRGDRLAQFLGSSQAADDFEAELQAARKTGITAARVQKLIAGLAAAAGTGVFGAEVYSHMHHATPVIAPGE